MPYGLGEILRLTEYHYERITRGTGVVVRSRYDHSLVGGQVIIVQQFGNKIQITNDSQFDIVEWTDGILAMFEAWHEREYGIANYIQKHSLIMPFQLEYEDEGIDDGNQI